MIADNECAGINDENDDVAKCNYLSVATMKHDRTRTSIQRAYSHYPVRIMPIERWKSYVTVNILGFGGGIISGDHTTFDFTVHESANLLVRTQGNTKIFKAVGNNFCNQNVSLSVEDNGLLIFAPDLTTCFEGADFRQQTQIECGVNGSIAYIDWYSSGRQGRDLIWSAKCIHTTLTFTVGDNCVLFDNQLITDSRFGSLPKKMGGKEVFGSLLLHGFQIAPLLKTLECFRERQSFEQHQLLLEYRRKCSINQQQVVHESFVSVTRLNQHTAVVRFIFPNAIYGYEFMQELFSPLASWLDGCVPYNDRTPSVTSYAKEFNPTCALSRLRAFKAKISNST